MEDNAQVGDVSTLLLEQLGYRVLRTDRPDAALALLARENDVALVFSDIVMPGAMDGLNLAREIQERYPNLPVLLATGYSSAAERVGTQFPIIRKPYDYNTLALSVKTALIASGMRQSAMADGQKEPRFPLNRANRPSARSCCLLGPLLAYVRRP